jgi:uncharacterized protein YlxW (UPF0749 family)
MRLRFTLVALLALLALAALGQVQNGKTPNILTPTPTSYDERIRQLDERVRSLEDQVRKLEAENGPRFKQLDLSPPSQK